MTTSEVFRDYLAMTPESAPWAYQYFKDGDPPLVWSEEHDEAQPNLVRAFSATSPLAPAPNPAWLYELVIHKDFLWLDPQAGGFFAAYRSHNHNTCRAEVNPNPIHACARALVAADPELRARLEACEDWKEYAG